MLAVREQLLAIHYPDITPANRYYRLRSGFHRGARDVHLLGPVKFHLPDVISVKHLHLHVIVDINSPIKGLKYPMWNEFVFAKGETVLKRLEEEDRTSKDMPVLQSASNNLNTGHEEL